MARIAFARGQTSVPKTFAEVAKRLAALESTLEQLTNTPGQFTPQVFFRDTIVGESENLVTVGTVTVPAGVTVTVLSGGEWRAI